MVNLPKDAKLELFNFLIHENAFGKLQNDNGVLDFLVLIWDLESMPSEDGRFPNAYRDIYQHTVNNNDWEDDYLFLERLKLLEDNDKFTKFIETILSPKCRSNENEIIKFVLSIDSYINKYGYGLGIDFFDETGIPIYKIKTKDELDNLPTDVPENKIPFFVHPTKVTTIPSFILTLNTSWNDYGTRSSYYLSYFDENGHRHEIGSTKIIYFSDEESVESKLPVEFTTLDNMFCSLGQRQDYYEDLRRLLKSNFESVLFALKDAAFDTEAHEKFENKSDFKNSLIRNNATERLLREIKYILYDYDRSNLYSFKYEFKPKFSQSSVDIKFNFSENNGLISNRIYAIIGKNGTGKTQFITSLPFDISLKKDENFVPRAPLFSKVIAVSYSVFDKFKIPKRTATFNYTYCGLRNESDETMSERSLVLRFHNAWKTIVHKERTFEWRSILLNFMEESIIDEFIIPIGHTRQNYTVSIEGFQKVKDKLSSGQSIILYIITQIVANIKFDSLLLFDEPETHLHPNAITQLMNSIYELVDKFESYCIITTHSPLIIRELMSRNVYIMEKNEDILNVNRIGIESFGENLSVLTDEVFGNKDIPKQYKKIIKRLITQGNDFDQIIAALQFDEYPLSLNTRLYIKGAIREGNAEF